MGGYKGALSWESDLSSRPGVRHYTTLSEGKQQPVIPSSWVGKEASSASRGFLQEEANGFGFPAPSQCLRDPGD